MFLTVSPNAVLDKIIFIDEFNRGSMVQASRVFVGVGGKGLDASVALRHLGQDTTGLIGLAGRAGRDVLDLVEGYGIHPAPVWVGGETRTAHIIAEQQTHQHTHIFTGGLTISTEQAQEFLQEYQRHLPQASWVLTGGKLPDGLEDDFFRRLADLAREASVPFLVDSWRQPLLACLQSPPAIVKMNQQEFGWTFDRQPADLVELAACAEQIYTQYNLNSLVVTCGADGMLACTRQGCFHALPPPQPVVNAAGAGDAASAALAWRLSLNDPWPEALRWAAAVSAASVLTEGTSDLHLKDVKAILPHVKVIILNP